MHAAAIHPMHGPMHAARSCFCFPCEASISACEAPHAPRCVTCMHARDHACTACTAAIPWTSGALFDQSAADAEQRKEAERLERLKNDASLPLVYFDVAIKGTHIGRIKMVLFTKEAPRAAENFRALCTGTTTCLPGYYLPGWPRMDAFG